MNPDSDELARQFEELRPTLLCVATALLGSSDEAKDIVQDAWLRLRRTEPAVISDLRAWLTTVVSRLCIDRLRSAGVRGDELVNVAGASGDGFVGANPELELMTVERLSLALAVVFEYLTPAQRVCFVLSDAFSVPFDIIARMLRTSAEAARKQASRARRRLREAVPFEGVRPAPPSELLEAFLAAARRGDIKALVAALDPEKSVSQGWDGALYSHAREAYEPMRYEPLSDHLSSTIPPRAEEIRERHALPKWSHANSPPARFAGWLGAMTLLAGSDVPDVASPLGSGGESTGGL